MDSSISILTAAIGAASVYALSRFLLPKRTPAPLPPGPKPKFLVGNIDDLPKPGEEEWLHYAKHKALYGPISSVTVLGQTIVIINDYKIALDLFERRGTNYSGRPVMHFAGDMCGMGVSLALLPYSDRFRAYRRNIHQVMGTKSAASRFHPFQEVEVRRFALRVLDNPKKLRQHIRTEAGAIILKISFGYTIEPREVDPLIELAEEALDQFAVAALPGRWMVDILPWLKNVPDWLPGTGFKQTAALWRRTITELIERPYAFTKQQMAAGTAKPSFTADRLSKGSLTEEEEYVIKNSAMSLYSGGAGTTVSSIYCFFLAMTLYPDAQKKAQEEIDRVIGTDRLPTLDDRPFLPYVNALAKEVLRWHPVAPMAIPHIVSDDNVYEGMFIPKGSVVVPNLWMFTHDPATYKDPHTFRPERFLGEKPEMDSHSLSFGIGRRSCPGRELADASVFLTILTSLAAFNIRKARDEKGVEIEPAAKFTPGIISYPADFECDITIRSEKAERLVRAVEIEHPWEESDAAALQGLSWE